MKTLTSVEKEQLLESLEKRFKKNSARHADIAWEAVLQKLQNAPEKTWHALHTMEESEGEPDVIGYDEALQAFIFCDCAAESPKGRRSLCYDQKALDSRKQHKPADSAISVAKSMGIELLDEVAYRKLQELGTFDTKTSSWIHTPQEVRNLGGALFGDYRFGRVFIYHNGADSYYGARGFRGLIKI